MTTMPQRDSTTARRNDPLRMTAAEFAIQQAVIEVEKMGSQHPMLAKAVSQLNTARWWVADYVDREKKS